MRSNRILATRTSEYDPVDDLRRSVEFAYEHIRERVASGGKGWREFPMSAWNRVETAPKDGTVFIGYWCGDVFLAWWNTEQGNWQEYPDGDFEDIVGEELTHWMPLPEPPK
jgi:hypothetical protein